MQFSNNFNQNLSKGGDRPETKGGIDEILKSFNNEHGYYNTIDLINFLTHYSIGEENEDRFLQQQIFRNMKNSFTEKYIPEQLERLVKEGRYISPENGYLDD